jgi:hypothetical protein
MGFRQVVARPAEHLVDNLPLAESADIGWKQKVDRQQLGGEPDDLCTRWLDLVPEFIYKGAAPHPA